MLFEVLNIANALVVSANVLTLNVVNADLITMGPISPVVATRSHFFGESCKFKGLATSVTKDWKSYYQHNEEIQTVEPDFKPAGSVIYLYEKQCDDREPEQIAMGSHFLTFDEGDTYKAGRVIKTSDAIGGFATYQAQWLPQFYTKWATSAQNDQALQASLLKHAEFLRTYVRKEATTLRSYRGENFEFPLKALVPTAASLMISTEGASAVVEALQDAYADHEVNLELSQETKN